MTFLLAATPYLRPYLEKLLPASPHRVCYLPDKAKPRHDMLRELAAEPDNDSALLLLGGADALPEDGLEVCARPILIPRVHNETALLLGSDEAYRALFMAYDGGICWMLPQSRRPVSRSLWEGDNALCYIADTQLGLCDTHSQARAIAEAFEWDFFQTPSDIELLSRLLRGSYTDDDALLVPVGAGVRRSCTRELFELL